MPACYLVNPSIGKLAPTRAYMVFPSRVSMGPQQLGHIRYAYQAYTKTIKMMVTFCASPLVACRPFIFSHSPFFQCLYRFGG